MEQKADLLVIAPSSPLLYQALLQEIATANGFVGDILGKPARVAVMSDPWGGGKQSDLIMADVFTAARFYDPNFVLIIGAQGLGSRSEFDKTVKRLQATKMVVEASWYKRFGPAGTEVEMVANAIHRMALGSDTDEE